MEGLSTAKRRCRRPFRGSRHAGGTYRLPRPIADDLEGRLQGFRNAAAAWSLANHLARYWSTPARLAEAFTVARRGADNTGGLAEVAELGMTPGAIRGALRTLEAVGFVVRQVVKGNGRQATAAGPRMAPIRFRFGPDFWSAFKRANDLRRPRLNSPGRSPFGTSRSDSRLVRPRPAAPHPQRETPEGRAWRELAALRAAERLEEIRAAPARLSPAALALSRRRFHPPESLAQAGNVHVIV